MATYTSNSFDVARASQQVQVPNNSIAKLMYYLDCICTLVEYDEPILNQLRDFRNYDELSDNGLRVLFLLCVKLDPDDLIGKILFSDAAGELCGTSLNRMYDIGTVRRSIVVVNSIALAGRTRQVKKIMFYRPGWLRTYYYEPLANLTAALQRERQQAAAREFINSCPVS